MSFMLVAPRGVVLQGGACVPYSQLRPAFILAALLGRGPQEGIADLDVAPALSLVSPVEAEVVPK